MFSLIFHWDIPIFSDSSNVVLLLFSLIIIENIPIITISNVIPVKYLNKQIILIIDVNNLLLIDYEPLGI